MRTTLGGALAHRGRRLYVLAAAICGALLVLAWAAPSSMGMPGAADGREKRMSAEELSNLREEEAKLGWSSAAQAPPELRIDEDPAGNPYVAGELLVTYEEQASEDGEAAANRKAEARVVEDIPEIDAAALSIPEVKEKPDEAAREADLERRKKALEADPNVEAVDYNYVAERLAVPNDTRYGEQWGLQRIKGPEAWDVARGAGAAIAIIDGGAQSNHPDLNGAFVSERDYINGDAFADDEDGHGTHVAGIAGAYTNNAMGVAGTAPEAPLYNYDVCSATSCPYSAMVSAVTDAANLGADVVNMSLGGGPGSVALEGAVNYAWNKGAVVVAAAGNERSSAPSYPAAYANVIAVSGIDYFDGNHDNSNYGSWVDVAAPSGDGTAPSSQKILSTVPTFLDPSGYGFKNGTSMASPYVAGVASLLASRGLTNVQVRQGIESTTTDLGPAGRDDVFGRGLVDARAAATYVPPAPPPPPPPPPPPAPAPNTPPRVTSWAPKTATADNTPTIRAAVVDDQHYLYKPNIRLYVDGRRVTTFRAAVGWSTRITYTTKNLKNGRHSARVVVTDPNGASAAKTWRFTVR